MRFNELWHVDRTHSRGAPVRLAKLDTLIERSGNIMLMDNSPPVSINRAPIPGNDINPRRFVGGGRVNSIQIENALIRDPQEFIHDFQAGPCDTTEQEYSPIDFQHYTRIIRSVGVFNLPLRDVTIETVHQHLQTLAPYFETYGFHPEEPARILGNYCHLYRLPEPTLTMPTMTRQAMGRARQPLEILRRFLTTAGGYDDEDMNELAHHLRAASGTERSFERAAWSLIEALQQRRIDLASNYIPSAVAERVAERFIEERQLQRADEGDRLQRVAIPSDTPEPEVHKPVGFFLERPGRRAVNWSDE